MAAADDLDHDQRLRGVWCIAARLCAQPAPGDERRLDLALFEPGAKLYCIPPARRDGECEVKVVGPRRRSGKLVAGSVYAKHLCDWRAEWVIDKAAHELIAPPWDEDFVSHDVAEQVSQSYEVGGDWPTVLLRDWNRSRLQRTIGAGPWYKRAAAAMKTLFVPVAEPIKLHKRRRDD